MLLRASGEKNASAEQDVKRRLIIGESLILSKHSPILTSYSDSYSASEAWEELDPRFQCAAVVYEVAKSASRACITVAYIRETIKELLLCNE